MACLIGIDLGTSSVRVVALDPAGEILAMHGQEYPIHQPAPGFAEQSPEEWWSAACACLRRVTETVSGTSERVAAIGLSGQMHGLVLLGSDAGPLREAIIWPDTRTADICREWEASPGAQAIGSVSGPGSTARPRTRSCPRTTSATGSAAALQPTSPTHRVRSSST